MFGTDPIKQKAADMAFQHHLNKYNHSKHSFLGKIGGKLYNFILPSGAYLFTIIKQINSICKTYQLIITVFAPFGGPYWLYFIAFPIPNFIGITKSISQFFVSIYLISPFSLFPQWLGTNTRILSISTHGLKFIKKIKWGIKN